MGILGVAFAAGLYWAAKKLHVDTDERIELLTNMLPGSNCGSCGYSGCAGMAKALAEGKAKPGACGPGGSKCAEQVAQFLGVAAGEVQKKVAQVGCRGNTSQDPRADYNGLPDCRAAHLVVAGPKACVYGCLGLGTCVHACKFDALSQDNRGVPVVNKEQCTGCGACADVCPRGVIKIVDAGAISFVRCSSPVDGKTTRGMCAEGCIGCRICERTCQYGAVHVTGGLARIDPTKCIGCGECALKCPRNCILAAGEDFVVATAG